MDSTKIWQSQAYRVLCNYDKRETEHSNDKAVTSKREAKVSEDKARQTIQ